VRLPAAFTTRAAGASKTTMAPFETISEPAIAALVDRFYAKARRDPVIGPVFNDAVHDWNEHLRKLCNFWSSVMLTSGRYKGNPMAAHMKHPIEPGFFDRWLSLWQETAGELFAPPQAAQFRAKAERIAESLKLGLFFRPEQAKAISVTTQSSIASRN
jgi:hemoglobin